MTILCRRNGDLCIVESEARPRRKIEIEETLTRLGPMSIPEISTPKEGMEVRVLFREDAIVEDKNGITIECDRIFEIKPYDYFQTEGDV